MELSVVIPCKNEARHFGTMLESLTRQSWEGSWEVVVADNGSTDATPGVAQSYSERLPRLLVLDAADRPGPGHARNRGVERSAGEKILFVDADDELGDGYVAAMAAALDAAELVCARVGFDRLNPLWVQQVWETRWQQEGPLDDFGFLPFAGAGTLGIRRSLLDEVGGFHQRHPELTQFEEADLCWRIQLAGHPRPVLVPDAVLHYRLPSDLSAVYRRGRDYPRGQLALYELYREHGMPEPPRVSLRHLAGAVRRIRERRDLARAALTLGRLVGQRSRPAVD